MICGIDPGHGGDNVGCAGGGLREEQLTLITALAVRDFMLRRDAGVRVILSRELDETVTLAERAARLAAADFVMSLHYDSSDKPDTGALSTYCFPDDEIARQAGLRAESVAPDALKPIKPRCQFVSRDDWTVRAYNVLQHHRPKPALLVEVGFLSNPRHVEFLTAPGGMESIATVLCDALGVGLLGVAGRVANPGGTV